MTVEYVTAAELAALIGATADDARVVLAAGGSNALVELWAAQPVPETPASALARRRARRPTTRTAGPPAEVNDITHQAALELAHALYRRHAAVGGVFDVGDLVSRLPADIVRPIRDLLDSQTRVWGFG